MITITVKWNHDTDGTISDAFACRPARASMGRHGDVILRGTLDEVVATVRRVLRPTDARLQKALEDADEAASKS